MIFLSHFLFLLYFLLSLFSSFSFCFSQPLSLPSLPYSYTSLSPILSESALRLHHLRHHQAYTNKLNEALIELRGKQKELAKLGIDIILTRLDQIEDVELRNKIRNQGGGYVNHQLFFSILQPLNYTKTPEKSTTTEANTETSTASSSSSTATSSNALSVPVIDVSSLPPPSAQFPSPSPSSSFSLALLRSFPSFTAFQTSFTSAALSLFGSGWVWLYIDGKGKEGEEVELKIGCTPNQDYIGSGQSGHIGVLILDVWEHAYYVDYQNRRDEYVKQWWWLINWKKVEELYENGMETRKREKGESEHRQEEL